MTSVNEERQEIEISIMDPSKFRMNKSENNPLVNGIQKENSGGRYRVRENGEVIKIGLARHKSIEERLQDY